MEVTFTPPCPDYDIRGTERWLEDMAAKGYHLCEGYAFQAGQAYFLTGEPKQIRYRMDAAKTVRQTLFGFNEEALPPEEEARAFHEEFSWKYVTFRGHFHIYACDDPAAPEMNTDPQIQAIALKQVTKRLWNQLLCLLIYGVFTCYPRTGFFFETLINQRLAVYLPRVIFVVLVCAGWLPGLVHLVRFRRKLKQGVFPEHGKRRSEGAMKFLNGLRFAPFVWLIAMLLVFSSSSFFLSSHDSARLEGPGTVSYPFPTVTELFPEAEVRYISRSGNYVAQWETEAAPESFDYSEKFALTLPDGSEATGSWNICWHETISDWIAYGYGLELQFTDFLHGKLTKIDSAVDGADRCAAYFLDPPDTSFLAPQTVLILVKDNIVIRATLDLDDDSFPIQYTPEELAQLLLDAMV